MLNNTRIVAVGVASALWLAIAAPGQNFDADWRARSADRKIAGQAGGLEMTWFTVDEASSIIRVRLFERV